MKALVNGEEVELSPEEKAAVLAEWAANEAAAAAAAVPQSVNPFPFKLALRQLGHYAAVKAWAYAPGNDVASDAWESALEIKRSNELIAAAAAALDLSVAEVDAIFALAAQIDATL